jgi:deoxyribose-phosphate aldolase
MKTLTPTIQEITKGKTDYRTKDNLKLLYSCIDLTNLNSFAKKEDIESLCQKALVTNFKGENINQVAAVCIYPTYVSLCKQLLEASKVDIATVTGVFPHSQSYPEVKYLETELAIKHGATEIDIVINLSSFLNGDESLVFDEIKMIKQVCGNHHLKVILETDLLKEKALIEEASMMSLEAGADFIKTSTGKDGSVASLEAAYIMCNAIKTHHAKTGFKAGLKPAGGIATSEEALDYYMVVKSVLGDEWLSNKLFRLGASRLAGNLLNDIVAI